MSNRRFTGVLLAPIAPLVPALAALAGVLALGVHDARADVVRDGRVGSAGPGAVANESDGAGGLRYLIRESDGHRPGGGQNLFHSFSRLNLESDETAVYQGDAGIRNLITTITGGRSSIDGKLASEIAGANLFLINPDGVVFGENATVDLSGALTVSTADQLIFSNGDVMVTSGAPPAILSMADPVGFGFLDAPAAIRVEGSRIALAQEQSLSLIGGDIDLRGGRSDGGVAFVSVPSGRINFVSLASAGQVEIESDGLRITGNPDYGDIAIADEIFVSSSGLGVDPLGDARNSVRPGRGSGAIFVRADDLLIRDADIRSLTVTLHDAAPIDIGLTGQLTIESVAGEQQSGIFADSGLRIAPAPGQVVEGFPTGIQIPGLGGFVFSFCTGVGICGIDYQASGRAGEVRILARDVALQNGGKITSRSEFSADAGLIDIAFSDEMRVVGRRGPGDVSQISTNSNGDFGNPGTIRIRSESGRLRLADFGALVIQNSSTGILSDTPGRIEVDVAELEMFGNARIDSSTRSSGTGGILDITARDRMTLSGRTDDENFTGISTLSQPGATGPAGAIRIATANLLMEEGAEISARPADATSLGAAGNLRFEIGDQLVMRDATISTQSPNAAGGNIELGVSGVVDMRRSSITTSVTSGPESGGNITLRPGPEALVLDHSDIIARADAGSGGSIDIEAGVVIADVTSAIDASSNTGIDGPVLINGVEGNIVPEVADLATPSADASSLLREPCAARRPGASNRFVVDEGRRISLAVDDYLSAPLATRLGAPEQEPLAAREPVDPADSIELAQRDASAASDCTF